MPRFGMSRAKSPAPKTQLLPKGPSRVDYREAGALGEDSGDDTLANGLAVSPRIWR